MSHIQRLSIQGIRSFNPEKPQDIKFFPMTIILGPNGAGKTSIIESLKYATTGLMPPSSNAGKTFIHDLLFVDEPIVRGQIRLQFKDVENKRTMIIRSMQASQTGRQKKSTVTFKQMNAVIKREDGVSIDQKLADINSELLKLIGVSKAILNNVIFCHQEEIHWPLSEGKILKEKFDDIFGSIPFTKALEKIKKYRDSQVKELQLLEKDVINTLAIKREADKRIKMMSEVRNKIEDEMNGFKNCQIKTDQLDSKINDLMIKEQKAETLFNEIASLEGSIQQGLKNLNVLKNNCPEDMFFRTKQEVDEELKNFDAKLITSQNDRERLESQLKENDQQYQNLSLEKGQYDSYVTKIQEYKNQINKYFQQLDDLVFDLSLSDETKLAYESMNRNDVRSVEITIDSIRNFISDEIKKLIQSTNDAKDEFVQRESELQEKLDSIKNEKNKIDTEIDIRIVEIKNIQTNLNQIRALSDEVASSESYLQKLETEISNYQQQLSKFDSEQNEKDYQDKTESLEMKKKTLQTEHDSLAKQISLANANVQKRIELDNLKEKKLEKQSKMTKIETECREIFAKFDADNGDFAGKLSRQIENQTVKYNEARSKMNNCEKDYCTQSTRLEGIQKSLALKENELQSIEKKLNSVCSVDQFENLLQSTEMKLNQLREEKSYVENLSPIMDRFVAMIEKEKSCPICEHDLGTDWVSKCSGETMNVEKLAEKLKKSKNDNPQNLEEINQKIQNSEELFFKLVSMKNDISKIVSMKEEISKDQEQITMIQKEMVDLRNQTDSYISEMDSFESEMNALNASMQSAIEYDYLIEYLKDIQQKIDECDLTESDVVELNMDDLNAKLEQKESEIKTCEQELSNIQKEFIQTTCDRNKWQNLLQMAMQNKFNREEKMRSQMLNIQQKKQLVDQLETHRQKLETLRTQSSELVPRIQELQTNLKNIRDVFEKIKNDAQRKIYRSEDHTRTVERIKKEMLFYWEEFEISKAKISDEHVEKLGNEIRKLITDKKALEEDLKRIDRAIANFELDRRNLSDYQTLLKSEAEIEQSKEKLKSLQQEVEMKNIGSIRKLRIEAERERQRVVAQKDFSKSRIKEYEAEIQRLKIELNQDYKNADEKHKKAVVDKVLTEAACEDLDKYYKALDFAITTFHKNKLAAINELIVQFWKSAYQGKDIDSIQIVADEEKRSASDKKRNFNYRVVMIRNSKMLDMRGRCSAGQKVLASLIIRMALAMIFSNTFTVLTLDEPTTNLDLVNVQSLAKAIITLQKINPNLQIVIITHDENFLSYFPVNQFYKVSKDNSGYSTISLQDVNHI